MIFEALSVAKCYIASRTSLLLSLSFSFRSSKYLILIISLKFAIDKEGNKTLFKTLTLPSKFFALSSFSFLITKNCGNSLNLSLCCLSYFISF